MRNLGPLRVLLDVAGIVIVALTFAGDGDPDVMFHIVWVILTAQAFLFGIRVSAPRIAVAAVAVTVFSGLQIGGPGRSPELGPELLLSEWPLMLGIIVMVALMAEREMTASRRYAGLYRRAADKLITAEEDQRRRLALDLHDGVGQGITAVNLTLDAASRALESVGAEGDRARELVSTARDLASDALGETRSVAAQLRPPRLHERGLASTIETLAANAGTPVEVTVSDTARSPGLIDEAHEVETFRIVQEALANATRHSRASSIRLAIGVERDALVIAVDDDGCGFTQRNRDPRSLGIPGMQERAAKIGARLSIRSGAGAGTTVRLAVPVRPAARMVMGGSDRTGKPSAAASAS
jgi:signal transduction histidine kinase